MADSVVQSGQDSGTRRDFLEIVAWSTAGIGAAVGIGWPLIDSMNPSADVLALASTEVDISGIEEGMAVTVTWRGKPVFIRNRTATEIEEAEATPVDDLRDPEPDADRVEKPEWLILVGICTHLGCVPIGNKPQDRGSDGHRLRPGSPPLS